MMQVLSAILTRQHQQILDMSTQERCKHFLRVDKMRQALQTLLTTLILERDLQTLQQQLTQQVYQEQTQTCRRTLWSTCGSVPLDTILRNLNHIRKC